MEYTIIIHEGYQRLQKEAEALTGRLADIVMQYSNMTSQQYHRILADYYRKVGNLECEWYDIYCNALTVRRKTELLRSAINRQVPVDLQAIEVQVAQEYQAYYERLQKLKMDKKIAEEYMVSPKLSKEETKELHALYIELVKVLHPDVKKHRTKKEEALWEQVVQAYECADLTLLRLLADVVRAMEPDREQEESENAFDVVHGKCDRLRASIDSYEKKIEELQGKFPFSKQEFLADKTAVAKQQEELREQIEQWRKYAAELVERYTELLAEI